MSPVAGWCGKAEGSEPVAVDPAGHQVPRAEALVRYAAAPEAGEAFRIGHLLRAWVPVSEGGVCGLRLDPAAQAVPVLLDLPGQQGLVSERELAGVVQLFACGRQTVRSVCGGVIKHGNGSFLSGFEDRTQGEQAQAYSV